MSAEPSSSYLPSLDGIRGLAILAVMLMHFTLLNPSILTSDSVFDRGVMLAALAGWTGVDLFFVLSGFLITGILLDSKGGPGYFRNFYMRRVLRIFPLYYASLVLLFVVIPRVLPSLIHDPAKLSQGQAALWLYVSNLRVGYVGGWDATPPLTGHYWSLSVEEQFYLVWPAVVYVLDRRKLLLVGSALLVGPLLLRAWLLHAGVAPFSLFVLTPTRMDPLAAGALLAVLARGPQGLAAHKRLLAGAALVGTVALATIVAIMGTIGQYDPLTQTWGYTSLALAFSGLIGATVSSQPGSFLHGVLNARWLRYIGLRSYGLYVIHPFVLKAVGRVILERPGSRLPQTGFGGQVFFWLVTFGIAALSAEVSWQLLEKRCLALKRFFPRGTAAPAPR